MREFGRKSPGVQMLRRPGIIIGRIPLSHTGDGAPGRFRLTFGAGQEIAVTHFHTFNHATLITARLPF